ncbi:hypothetical protein Ancab_003998 [Ancistrocladus abbreviatus]
MEKRQPREEQQEKHSNVGSSSAPPTLPPNPNNHPPATSSSPQDSPDASSISSDHSAHPPSTPDEENQDPYRNHLSINPAQPANRPSVSPPESDASSISSTFHGFSPEEDRRRFYEINPSETLSSAPLPPQPAVVNRLIREEPSTTVTKMESDAATGFANEGGTDGSHLGGGGSGRRGRRSLSILRSVRIEKMVKRAALGLRICEFVTCLISFSVMASDKNRGWALDSFDRYTEFRYSVSVNVIGFVYSGFQAFSVAYQLAIGDQISGYQLRYYFDFAADQILAYLLLSASSSAGTRVGDWISNWGKDKFPGMAAASVGMSCLAFVAFAFSSLISGYVLCTRKTI